MAFSHLIGPTAACYGDVDPTERLLVFMHIDGSMWRVSLTSETVEVIVKDRAERKSFSAEQRRALLRGRESNIDKVVDFFKLPADFAA